MVSLPVIHPVQTRPLNPLSSLHARWPPLPSLDRRRHLKEEGTPWMGSPVKLRPFLRPSPRPQHHLVHAFTGGEEAWKAPAAMSSRLGAAAVAVEATLDQPPSSLGASAALGFLLCICVHHTLTNLRAKCLCTVAAPSSTAPDYFVDFESRVLHSSIRMKIHLGPLWKVQRSGAKEFFSICIIFQLHHGLYKGEIHRKYTRW